MFSVTKLLTLVVLAGVPMIFAHGLIVAASGDAGGAGIGLGAESATTDNQQDVTIFGGNDYGTVGRLGNVNIGNIASILAASEKIAGSTLPQVTTGGMLTMTYRQLNDDGAGPVKCQVSANGSTTGFVAMTVTTQVPGTAGQADVSNTDFPLVAQMPAGLTCTGTIGTATNACIVQCKNPVGPFGSNIVVQSVGAGNSGTAGNAMAAPASPAGLCEAAPETHKFKIRGSTWR
ncbi:hypothetical protein MMC26_000447 [Xylographa opegraphella]|nr:hypothetical protein [Xylographa opegraphella]